MTEPSRFQRHRSATATAADRVPSRRLRTLALSLGLLLGGALAWTAAHAESSAAATTTAQDPTSRMRLSSAQVQQAFRYIDRDGDQRLSRAEIAAFPRIERYFERIDTDGDGSVSPAEFEVALQQAS